MPTIVKSSGSSISSGSKLRSRITSAIGAGYVVARFRLGAGVGFGLGASAALINAIRANTSRPARLRAANQPLNVRPDARVIAPFEKVCFGTAGVGFLMLLIGATLMLFISLKPGCCRYCLHSLYQFAENSRGF